MTVFNGTEIHHKTQRSFLVSFEKQKQDPKKPIKTFKSHMTSQWKITFYLQKKFSEIVCDFVLWIEKPENEKDDKL